MSRIASPAVIAWLALLLHVAAGVLARRRPPSTTPIVWLNLAAALCVIAYAARDWYAIITRELTWYLSDQLVPLAAVLICLLSGLTLAGRYNGTLPHWQVYGLDVFILLGAAAYLTFFKLNRLI